MALSEDERLERYIKNAPYLSGGKRPYMLVLQSKHGDEYYLVAEDGDAERAVQFIFERHQAYGFYSVDDLVALEEDLQRTENRIGGKVASLAYFLSSRANYEYERLNIEFFETLPRT